MIKKVKISEDELSNIYWRLEAIQHVLVLINTDLEFVEESSPGVKDSIKSKVDSEVSEIEEIQDKIRKARKIKKIEG